MPCPLAPVGVCSCQAYYIVLRPTQRTWKEPLLWRYMPDRAFGGRAVISLSTVIFVRPGSVHLVCCSGHSSNAHHLTMRLLLADRSGSRLKGKPVGASYRNIAISARILARGSRWSQTERGCCWNRDRYRSWVYRCIFIT